MSGRPLGGRVAPVKPSSSPRGRPRRIGWVIGDQLARLPFYRTASLTTGGVGLARYAWLAAHVNARPEFGLHHEVYQRWRRYDGLVFLKSMGPPSLALLRRGRERGVATVFDANVNYYERSGVEYYQGMLPSAEQTAEAVAITAAADGVIADSEFVLTRCLRHNPNATWIPDSVAMELVPPVARWRRAGAPLRLLWSGEAVKLFELLAVKDVLGRYARHVELVLVTNALSALERWHAGWRAEFEALLARVPHRIVPYRGIAHLFGVYAEGGVAISPRFLDNSYNLGHTEWKITLAMACGRVAVCSPVPSYARVAERAGGRGIRVCATAAEWEAALEALLGDGIDLDAEEAAARAVVERHYATAVVAAQHSAFLGGLLARAAGRN
jgi:glycosyltransferase involved in cell wall biosynthesis